MEAGIAFSDAYNRPSSFCFCAKVDACFWFQNLHTDDQSMLISHWINHANPSLHDYGMIQS